MCCFRLVRVLVFSHGRVIVHLQTWLPVRADRFVLLLFLAALGALAAAAAVFAAEARGRGDDAVPRGQRVQGPGQKLPVAEELGQVAWAVRLHYVDNNRSDNYSNNRHANADQDLPTSHRQSKYGQGENQEDQDEVDDGKPAVFGGFVPQPSGQPDGQPHEGDWVPQYDAKDVEEEMAKCNLEKNTHHSQTGK